MIGKVGNAVQQSPPHIGHGVDGIAHYRFQPGDILGEIRLVGPHGLVWPKGRQNYGRSVRIGRQQLMGLQVVGRVVSGADKLHIGLADDTPDRHVRLSQDLVALVVDPHSALTGKGLRDPKIPLKL